MKREEALRYIKSAAGHLIVTDRKVMGMALLEAWDALRNPWVKTADKLPTEADAGYGDEILTLYQDSETMMQGCDYWAFVAKHPEYFPYWMPLPPLPETAGSEPAKVPE